MVQQSQLVTLPAELLHSIFEVVEEDRPTGEGFAKCHHEGPSREMDASRIDYPAHLGNDIVL